MKRHFFLSLLFITFSTLFAKEPLPPKPVELIVGFGVGGSSDRLARAMAPYLETMLNAPLKIITKEGNGSQIAANYVLSNTSNKKYTIFCSTFTPYLANTIFSAGARYAIDDFEYINIQWFDNDIIATHIDSSFKSLPQLLQVIKKGDAKLKIAVMEDSSGHLLLKMLLHNYKVSAENISIVLYNNGKILRNTLVNKEVDVMIISSQGSELVREHIRTLAVFSPERHPQWDVPTVNEALEPLGFSVPYIAGSMRGFAVSKKYKEEYPKEYALLVEAFLKIIAKKEVQKYLRDERIGGVWSGPHKSNMLVKESFEVYKEYAHLLRD